MRNAFSLSCLSVRYWIVRSHDFCYFQALHLFFKRSEFLIKMLIFNVLLLCLAGAICVEGCCFARQCPKQGDTHYDCIGAPAGCTAGSLFSSSWAGKCVAGKSHGTYVGKNSDYKCGSGEEQCGYCSDTCETSNGCKVVPERTFGTKISFRFIHVINPYSFQIKDAVKTPIAKKAYIATGDGASPESFVKALALVSQWHRNCNSRARHPHA